MSHRPSQIIRTRRRTIALVVADGQFVVRAPKWVPNYEIEQFISDKQQWLTRTLARSERRLPKVPLEHPVGWYRREARKVINARCAFFAEVAGLSYRSIRITDARSRWGSCNFDKQTLNFAWRLILTDPAVLDYVVVHEIMHLKIPNHSARYWQAVGEIIPDHQELRRWLRANSSRFDV